MQNEPLNFLGISHSFPYQSEVDFVLREADVIYLGQCILEFFCRLVRDDEPFDRFPSFGEFVFYPAHVSHRLAYGVI